MEAHQTPNLGILGSSPSKVVLSVFKLFFLFLHFKNSYNNESEKPKMRNLLPYIVDAIKKVAINYLMNSSNILSIFDSKKLNFRIIIYN